MARYNLHYSLTSTKNYAHKFLRTDNQNIREKIRIKAAVRCNIKHFWNILFCYHQSTSLTRSRQIRWHGSWPHRKSRSIKWHGKLVIEASISLCRDFADAGWVKHTILSTVKQYQTSLDRRFKENSSTFFQMSFKTWLIFSRFSSRRWMSEIELSINYTYTAVP